MDVTGFIAGKLRFKGKVAMVSIAISFFVMILAVSISYGFREKIRDGLSSFSGDIQLTPPDMNFVSEGSSLNSEPSYLSDIENVPGVKNVYPAIYRAGVIKNGEDIHGVLFKGVENYADSLSGLGVSIPRRLSELLKIGGGDSFQAYFVGDRVKVRKFSVVSVYESPVQVDESLMVFASLEDMRRLNGWDENEASVLEVTLDDAHRDAHLMSEATGHIGMTALLATPDDESAPVAQSMMDKYPQLFDWLNLIDFNVVFILLLMTIVAGFNMISGLLILLFRSISTIGTLKSMGMTDRSISMVFLKVSSNLVLKGMAIGNALAFLFCIIQSQTHLIKLDPTNYFLSYVPVTVNIPMVIAADVIAYVAIMLLLLIPTKFIARVDPAQTVRAQ